MLLQENRQIFCLKDQKSWCKWQLDKLNDTSNYKSKLNLPKAIRKIIKPIFQDLSKNELLEKCIHTQTQN